MESQYEKLTRAERLELYSGERLRLVAKLEAKKIDLEEYYAGLRAARERYGL